MERPGCFGNAFRSMGKLREDTTDAGEIGRSSIEGALLSDDFEPFFETLCRPSCESLLEFWFSKPSLRRPLGVAEV